MDRFEKAAKFGAVMAKVALKKNKMPDAEDIVNMDSSGGRLADFLGDRPFGGERAGRTQAMADAMNEPTTFGVKHPMSQTYMYGLPLGALGGIAGAVGGGLLGPALLGTTPQEGATAGGGLGALAGVLGGFGASSAARRREMARINDLYNAKKEKGQVIPKYPNLSLLSSLLFPLRGPHRTGQIEAVRAMKNNLPIDEVRAPGRDGLYAYESVPALPRSSVALLLHGYGQNIKTQLDSALERQREDIENKSNKNKEKKAGLTPPIAEGANKAMLSAPKNIPINDLKAFALGNGIGTAGVGLAENMPVPKSILNGIRLGLIGAAGGASAYDHLKDPNKAQELGNYLRKFLPSSISTTMPTAPASQRKLDYKTYGQYAPMAK